MKVLFSAIGSTDPISNCADGGVLHICRVYRPDKVYLYLSKEMCQYHDKDDRYRRAVHLLGKELGHTFEVEAIRDESMERVQVFDAFINSFERLVGEIQRKDQPEEFLLNVSSGTPAMKCSLQIISMLWKNVQAIQVSTPAKSSNKMHENKDTYQLEEQWECNLDREEGFENRCSVSDAKYLLDRIRKENIHKHLLAYDYEAAKLMAETLYQAPSEEFWGCLEIAIARNRLDLRFVNGNRKKYGIDRWFPIVQEREMKEFEYLLAMQAKLWKKQYIDFIRDVTPVFYSLSERVLKRYCDLSFQDIGTQAREGAWCLSLEKLKEKGIRPNVNWGDFTHLSSYVVLMIMEQVCEDENILELMRGIRTVEREVRNLAAHEIVGVTEEWVEKKTGFRPGKVMDMLFELAGCAGIQMAKKDREAYHRMNEQLWEML